MYKLYTGILNSRIVSYMENEGIYADEQNGFRAKRSCSDHLFTLTFIIHNRKSSGQATYVAYIDAEKAFDKIHRELLLYKAMIDGLGEKMYNALKNIYTGSYSAVNLNSHVTDWFECKVILFRQHYSDYMLTM